MAQSTSWLKIEVEQSHERALVRFQASARTTAAAKKLSIQRALGRYRGSARTCSNWSIRGFTEQVKTCDLRALVACGASARTMGWAYAIKKLIRVLFPNPKPIRLIPFPAYKYNMLCTKLSIHPFIHPPS
jgi:hypothetical protein